MVCDDLLWAENIVSLSRVVDRVRAWRLVVVGLCAFIELSKLEFS